MSEYGFYLERARRAHATLAAVEGASSRKRDDRGIRLTVASARKIAERTERELEAAAVSDQIDICRYRLVASDNDTFGIRGVSRSLGAFQEMFTFVFDALVNQPKQIARLSRRMHDETALEVGYTFEGSLGVVLLAPGGISLFGYGKFDRTFDVINDLFDLADENELRNITRKIGKAAVQKVFEWSNANFVEGFAVDLKWITPSESQKGRYVTWREFQRIAGLIGQSSDRETTEISSRGALVGLSAVAKTFHFVEPDGEFYRGQLSEDFPVSQEWTINHSYIADIVVDRTTRLATGEDVTHYRLKHLREITKS